MIFPRSLSLTLAALAVTTSAIAQTTVKWVPLNQDPPPAVLSATPVGPKPSGDILHITVAMPYADPVGMKQFADSVSNPASPNYRQFLTPAQIGLRFGQPTSVVQQVQNYLAAQGMTVKLVAANHIAITADCTVAQAEAAFNTNFENYTVLDSIPVFIYHGTLAAGVDQHLCQLHRRFGKFSTTETKTEEGQKARTGHVGNAFSARGTLRRIGRL